MGGAAKGSVMTTSKPMNGKCVILGVTGSIAAYKAADLASKLVAGGAQVHVVMTDAASRIVAPITLQTLSRNPVHCDMWQSADRWQPGHIELADKADLLVVAPATANTIAQFAHGLAPDLLSNIYLATRAPVLIAPAMNGKMLSHPATQANITTLRGRGHHFIEPASGMLACGYEGKGKLAAVEDIFSAIAGLLGGAGNA
jgi:phosphopantothenoylcysteine decarboxylase/phosphopantothenate--cysteine ligase